MRSLLLVLLPVGALGGACVGFEIGTELGGFDVASDGVAKRADPDGTPPWDTSNELASAMVDENTFYLALKQGPLSGDAPVYFTASVNVVEGQDEAQCAPTLNYNRSFIAQNSSTFPGGHPVSLTVSYNCAAVGLTLIQVVITPTGQDKMLFEWHRTSSSALSLIAVGGATPQAAVIDGVPQAGWFSGPGQHLADAYETVTPFTLSLRDGALPLSREQPLLAGAITLDFTPNIVGGGVAQGTAMAPVGGVVTLNETLTLEVVYNCKGFGYVNVTMTIRMAPFRTTTLRWGKYCEHVEGFDVFQTAPSEVEAVKDGIARAGWAMVNNTIMKSPGETKTVFQITSSSIQLSMKVNPLTVTGDTDVCSPTLTLSDPNCADAAGCIVAPGSELEDASVLLTIEYNCHAGLGGELELAISLVLLPARSVVFGFKKFWARDPTCDVTWLQTNATNAEPTGTAVVVDGNINPTWAANATEPSAAAPVAKGFNLALRDSSHLLFLVSTKSIASIHVNAVDPTNKDCDPVVRGPFAGRRIVDASDGQPVDVTMWCKSEVGGAQAFSVTIHSGAYSDIQFFYTSQVRFRAGFQLLPCSGQEYGDAQSCELSAVTGSRPAWDSGSAQGNWVQSPSQPVVRLADTATDEFFLRDLGASDVPIGTPELLLNDTSLCAPVVTLRVPGAPAGSPAPTTVGKDGVVLSVEYNCTEVIGTTDMVLFLPIVGYSAALIRWQKHSFPALPSAPRTPMGVPTWNSVDLTIAAPNGNGALIDGYVVTAAGAGGYMLNVTLDVPLSRGHPTTVHLGNLKEGAAYKFAVAARNIAGTGAFSNSLDLATTKRFFLTRWWATNSIFRTVVLAGGAAALFACALGSFLLCGGVGLIKRAVKKKKRKKRAGGSRTVAGSSGINAPLLSPADGDDMNPYAEPRGADIERGSTKGITLTHTPSSSIGGIGDLDPSALLERALGGGGGAHARGDSAIEAAALQADWGAGSASDSSVVGSVQHDRDASAASNGSDMMDDWGADS